MCSTLKIIIPDIWNYIEQIGSSLYQKLEMMHLLQLDNKFQLILPGIQGKILNPFGYTTFILSENIPLSQKNIWGH